MRKTPAWVLDKAALLDCACGCGFTLLSLDNNGRPRRYLRGHSSRVNNPGLAAMLAKRQEKEADRVRVVEPE